MWGEGGKCVLLEVQNLRKILGCMQAPTIQRLTRDYVVHTYILITCMYFMCMCTDHVCMYIHCLTIKKKKHPTLFPSLSRFICGKVSFADQSERENPPKGSSVVNMLYGSKPLRDAYSSVVKLYESFVGPIHIRAMSRLLGYQGIAMILEQLLWVTEGQVQCVTAISE